ncbi:MAG: hypothetical protein ABR581_05750 [Thermoleophilaceae bacterium]
MAGTQVILELDGREVPFSNPEKVFFPAHGGPVARAEGLTPEVATDVDLSSARSSLG